MSYSKRSKLSDDSKENLKDFCPRCTRIVKNTKGRRNPKILLYYKRLCKNSKCFIHKFECSTHFKRMQPGKIREINLPEAPHSVEEFEDDLNFLETVDVSMFTKIESAVEYLDLASETCCKNVVGYRQIIDVINKTIIWPLKKPEIFKGLRTAPKGILLFGPPGTEKTSLGKFIASQTNSTFFNISASTLSYKWVGETETLLRTLFLVAKARQPSVIFIDEIDSILANRNSSENESTRRLINEFLFCMKTIDGSEENRVLVVGATSRPEGIDETVRPIFLKRIHLPLPDENDRKEILTKLLECECHSLDEVDINNIVKKTEGYSVVDIRNLSQEAAMSPIKSLAGTALACLKPDKIRPISLDDFYWALKLIKPTVTNEQVKACETWDALYGYGGETNSQ